MLKRAAVKLWLAVYIIWEIDTYVCAALSPFLLNRPLLHWLEKKRKRGFKWSGHTLGLHNKSLDQVTFFNVWEEQAVCEGKAERNGEFVSTPPPKSWLTAGVGRELYLAGTLWARTHSLTCLKSCGLCTSTGLRLSLTHYTESEYPRPL